MFSPVTTLSEQISNVVERIALEMRVLLATLTTKADAAHKHVAADISDLSSVIGGGADGVEVVQQYIAFVNGYDGSELDYRDYLDHTASDVLDRYYAFGTGYLEGATS